MNLPGSARPKAPYGIAFAIADLLTVRAWAEHRRLIMVVALDQMIDGAEFEELLIVLTPDRRWRKLTLARLPRGVMMQTCGAAPASFDTVDLALAAVPCSMSRPPAVLDAGSARVKSSGARPRTPAVRSTLLA